MLVTQNKHLVTGVAQWSARRAHNPEVRCSNHLSGILQFAPLKKWVVNASDVTSPVYLGGLSILCSKTSKPFTGVAQRQRDGLITRRSHDRNVSPVFFTSPLYQKPATQHISPV